MFLAAPVQLIMRAPTTPSQVSTCFLRKGKISRVLTSTLYKRRQETAEGSLRDALQRFQTGVAFVSMGVLHRTSTGVDSLIARSAGADRRASRKERKRMMMEQHEIPPQSITYFDDMVLGAGGFATVQVVEYQETAAAAKVVSMPEAGTDARASAKITKMFVNELHAMVQLRSAYTVNVFGAITSVPDKLVLVMEFMEGDVPAILCDVAASANLPTDRRLMCVLECDRGLNLSTFLAAD